MPHGEMNKLRWNWEFCASRKSRLLRSKQQSFDEDLGRKHLDGCIGSTGRHRTKQRKKKDKIEIAEEE